MLSRSQQSKGFTPWLADYAALAPFKAGLQSGRELHRPWAYAIQAADSYVRFFDDAISARTRCLSVTLAEGLGIRAVARVFEVDPNTVLQWLVKAADHTAAYSRYFLHDVRITQAQLDELLDLLSVVKAGKVSEAEAIKRLSRSPRWV